MKGKMSRSTVVGAGRTKLVANRAFPHGHLGLGFYSQQSQRIEG